MRLADQSFVPPVPHLKQRFYLVLQDSYPQVQLCQDNDQGDQRQQDGPCFCEDVEEVHFICPASEMRRR